MKGAITLFIFLATWITSSQVGINTDLPDSSSILHINSDSKGLLTPRMSSIKKMDIVNPAIGLLVYDTTLKAFQYYDGTDWDFIEKSSLRNKYKLIKNISDLSDELVQGGNNSYELQTDFLYEINGTIVFDFPININGAYIEGVDSSSDRLFNASGGPLFQGSTGGSIRNMTVIGNNNPIFNLNGSTGTELFIVNNTVFVGASSIGEMSGLGTVFLSVTQFVNNQDGLEISDIDSFFVSNIFWTSSNTGTFLKVSGNFKNLQMNGGRIEAESPEIGIDVSLNPTIVNDATLSQLSFVGDGTFVKKYLLGSYLGYNFTNDWNVNCSGIPLETDQAATGNFYYNGSLTSGFSQSISGAPVEIQGNGSFTATDLFRFSAVAGNNELVYEGKKTRNVKVNVSLSVRVQGASGDFYAFAIAKNGTIATETNSIVNIFNDSQIQNVALNGVLTLEPGDTISVFIDRLTNSNSNPDTLVVFSENLSVN